MPKTVFSSGERQEILDRIAKLRPDRKPTWGSMNCAQMLTHCALPLCAAMGELSVKPKNIPLFRFPPLRHAIIHWLPIPKGAPTAPEFIPASGGDWDAARTGLVAALQRFGDKGEKGERFVAHPAFGVLTTADWGILTWKHIDHHLRQFHG